MKRLVTACILVFWVCFGLTSSALADIHYYQEDWGITLDANQSITCVAHFVWYGIEFNDVPNQVPAGVYPDYDNGGRWNEIGWEASLSSDNKIAYVAGPQVTNNTDVNNLGWFVYTLSYLWDDADPNYDPNWPVYIDTAIYDGPYGSDPIESWGWRGTPGDPNSWENSIDPYVINEPWYTDDFFDNPAPEPATICLLSLGTAFIFVTRRRRPAFH